MAGQISMGARGEIKAAIAFRYSKAGRIEKTVILDELFAVTRWHRKHAVRALAANATPPPPDTPRQRNPTYDAAIKDALVALWEASDRICGKRLKVMIPTLLPSLERHGRLTLGKFDRALVLSVSAATIDRQLVETKIAAAGGKRRRVGFYSAVRREVPIRTFNDWNDPVPGTYRLLDEPKAAPAGTFTDVAILDLKVDLKDLVGKFVRVNASGSYTGEHLILSDPNSTFDTNGVSAKLDKLPRETRKWIVANCSDDPCAITIEGEVKKDIGILAPGIAASNAIYK